MNTLSRALYIDVMYAKSDFRVALKSMIARAV